MYIKKMISKILVIALMIEISHGNFTNNSVSNNFQTIIVQNNRAPKPSEYSSCYWEDIKNNLCCVNCYGIDPPLISGAMEYFQSEHPECEQLGFNLILSSVSYFPDFIMTAKWFVGNVIIRYLDIKNLNLNEIEPDAFLATAFTHITHLTLNGMGVKVLRTGIFNGLSALKELTMIFNGVQSIQSNLLEPTKNTLTKLTIEQTSRTIIHSLNGLTGYAQLPMLKDVILNYNNFQNTITKFTFLGLVAVENLDLSSAKIAELGDNSFDPIATTIKYVNLRNNLLVTLPEHLFNNIVWNANAKFNFFDNRFVCNCSLQVFKYFLINYPNNFDDEVVCYNQPYRYSPIVVTDFCHEIISSPIIPSTITTISTITSTRTTTLTTTSTTTTPITPPASLTTTPTTGPPTTTPTTPTTTPPVTSSTTPATAATTTPATTFTTTIPTSTKSNSAISTTEETEIAEMNRTLKCVDLNSAVNAFTLPIIDSKFSIKLLDITTNGDVILKIDNNLKDFILLWFNKNNLNNSTYEYFECMNNLISNVTIGNLQLNEAYTFCLMDKTNTTISPLNCISYYIASPQTIQDIWISEDYKIATISLIIFLFLLSLTISVLIGIYLQRNYFFCIPKINNIPPDAITSTPSDAPSNENKIRQNIRNPMDDLPPPYQQYADSGNYVDAKYFSKNDIVKNNIFEKNQSHAIDNVSNNIYGLEIVPTHAPPKPTAPAPHTLLPNVNEVPYYLTTTAEINKITIEDEPIYAVINKQKSKSD